MAPPAGFDRRPPPPPVPGLRGCLPLAFAPMTPVRPEGPPRAQHSCRRGCPRSYGGLVPPADRRKVTPDGRSLALSPPWTPAASVAASLLVALVAALVWHTRWPDPADAELMRLQEAARVRGDGIATAIAYAVGPLVVLAGLASAAQAWRVRRWDAVVLALVAAPGTLVTELMLKQVVYRQRPDGGAALLYPSGHVAVATAAAVTAVLVARATLAPPRTIMRIAWLAGWLVVVIAAARLVQTVHYMTDVVGGAAIGLAVTGWVALAITAGCRPGLLMAARSRLPGRRCTSRPGRTNAFRATPRARTDLDDLGSTAAGSTGMPRVPRPSPPRPRRSRRQPGTPST
jgi:membrane-associated phospholipid phosphatase